MNTEVSRYIIAGALAFTADFTTLYVCTEYGGLHYLVSNVFGYFAGLAVAYTLNTRWVFNHRRFGHASGTELFIFNAIVLTGLAISEGMMALLAEWAGLHYLYAKIIASVFVAVFNYVAKKYILFHDHGAAERAASD